MRYDRAYDLSQGCKEAIASTYRDTGHKEPPPDTESTLVCKEKVRRSRPDVMCIYIGGSECPLGKT